MAAASAVAAAGAVEQPQQACVIDLALRLLGAEIDRVAFSCGAVHLSGSPELHDL
jgi:hypothetical protein